MAHVTSHELTWDDAGIDGLQTNDINRLLFREHFKNKHCCIQIAVHLSKNLTFKMESLKFHITYEKCVCGTCVGSRDQFCPERIRRSTRSPSLMESAVLLSSTR